jgi:hypothetical protein
MRQVLVGNLQKVPDMSISTNPMRHSSSEETKKIHHWQDIT